MIRRSSRCRSTRRRLYRGLPDVRRNETVANRDGRANGSRRSSSSSSWILVSPRLFCSRQSISSRVRYFAPDKSGYALSRPNWTTWPTASRDAAKTRENKKNKAEAWQNAARNLRKSATTRMSRLPINIIYPQFARRACILNAGSRRWGAFYVVKL